MIFLNLLKRRALQIMLSLFTLSHKNTTYLVCGCASIKRSQIHKFLANVRRPHLTSGGFQEDTIPLSQMQGLHCLGEAIHSQGTHFPEVCHDSKLMLAVVVFAPPQVAFDIPATTVFVTLVILDAMH
jgi:hypothetical protein